MFTPSLLPRTLEASFRDLGSTSYATRAAAIADLVKHALGDAGARTRAVPLLERALASDTSSAVRAAAAVALADLGAGEALATLLVAVEDDDAHVRQMALTALGEIGDPRARPRLERALKDRRPEVRYQAVIAFARAASEDPGAVAAALSTALDDADAEIRYIAMRLAEEHRVEGELPVRAAQLVDEADAALGVVAALYLARRGNQRGQAAVVDVVAQRRRTPVLEDEQACVEIAGELGLREAVPHLERRTWGAVRSLGRWLGLAGTDRARCAWHARVALATMGHSRAQSEIMRDLSSWRRDVRASAAVAAARSGIVPTT
jgi:hypothetical protein